MVTVLSEWFTSSPSAIPAGTLTWSEPAMFPVARPDGYELHIRRVDPESQGAAVPFGANPQEEVLSSLAEPDYAGALVQLVELSLDLRFHSVH